MDVHVEGRPEALHEGDGACLVVTEGVAKRAVLVPRTPYCFREYEGVSCWSVFGLFWCHSTSYFRCCAIWGITPH